MKKAAHIQVLWVYDGDFAILKSQAHVEIAHRIVKHLTVFTPRFHRSYFFLRTEIVCYWARQKKRDIIRVTLLLDEEFAMEQLPDS